MIRAPVSISLICLLAATGASAQLPPDTEVITGESRGALYAIYAPATWNGDLVLYAHGYVPRTQTIELPTNFDEVRDLLVEDGYAVAYSSYSQNGWAVREGSKDTEHLAPLFRSSFGDPDNVYVIGRSMGGLIAVMLAEKHHGKFDGALSVCGAVGGALMTTDYFTDVRVLFDAYFPDVVPGTALDIPEGTDPLMDVLFPAYGAMFSDIPTSLQKAMELGAVLELGMYWENWVELTDSIAYALYFNSTNTSDWLDRCKGVFFDNTEGYTYPVPLLFDPPFLDEAALNTAVEHYTIEQNCHAYLKNWYEPTGKLRIPVLTLHDERDPLAPIKHEWEYASRVGAEGSSDWLVQRNKDAWGHCTSSASEVKEAFDELVLWVEQGVRPVP